VFTSEEFNEAYPESVERGYSIEHDFELNETQLGPENGPEQRESELPTWFAEAFPFLVPLAENLKEIFPKALAPTIPYLVLGVPAALLVLIAAATIRRRRPRSKGSRGTGTPRSSETEPDESESSSPSE
jgi:hypothetical protein